MGPETCLTLPQGLFPSTSEVPSGLQFRWKVLVVPPGQGELIKFLNEGSAELQLWAAGFHSHT